MLLVCTIPRRRSYTNLLNEAYGKEIWYSEGIAPCNMPEYTALADDCGIKGKNGLIDVANRIINSYYNGKNGDV